MFRIGSEVTALTRSTYTTGIQRVILESHKQMQKPLTPMESLRAVPTETDKIGKEYLSNEYLKSDVLLQNEIVPLSNIDCLVLFDTSLILSFQNIFMERQKRKLKVVTVVHDLLPMKYPEFFPVQDAQIKYRRFIQSVFKVSDVLICESHAVRSEILELPWNFSGRIEVSHLGAHQENEVFLNSNVPSLSLMYVSTIEPRKGHNIVLDAFDILLRNGKDVFLTLIGAYGWDSEGLVLRIRNHIEFGKRLRWLEACSEEMLNEEYRNHSISLHASKAEGFGLSMEEALFFGHKVIASSINVFQERAQANLYFHNGTASDLSSKIEQISKLDYSNPSGKQIRHMRDYAKDVLKIIRSLNEAK